MMFVYVIFLLIKSSYEQRECGKILTGVSFALEGVKETTAPWVVSMGVYEGDEYKVKCTGTLVTPDILVTAAHCLRHYEGRWVIRAGVTEKDAKGGVEASFKRVSSHPEYNWPQMYYDIWVALLNESMPLSASISTLCLPDSPYDVDTKDGQGVTVQGWGVTNGATAGIKLNEIDVIVRSRQG